MISVTTVVVCTIIILSRINYLNNVFLPKLERQQEENQTTVEQYGTTDFKINAINRDFLQYVGNNNTKSATEMLLKIVKKHNVEDAEHAISVVLNDNVISSPPEIHIKRDVPSKKSVDVNNIDKIVLSDINHYSIYITEFDVDGRVSEIKIFEQTDYFKDIN